MRELRFNALRDWWFVALPVLLSLAMSFGVPLGYETLYASDMNQNLAWTHRLADPAAFPGSRVIDYEAWLCGQLGLRVIYWPLVQFVSPLLAGKILALALGFSVYLLAGEIGAALWPGHSGASPLAILTLACMQRPASLNFWAGIEGGMARSFASPLVLTFLLGVLSRRPRLIGIAVVLAATLYPPIFLVLMTSTFVVLWVEKDLAKPLFPWLGVAGVAVGLVYLHLHMGGYGPAPKLSDANSIPALGNPEILPVIRATLWQTLVATHLGLGLPAALAIVLGLLTARVAPAATRAAAAVFLSCEACFVVGYALYFRLYFPDRYLSPIALLAWLLGTTLLYAAIDRLRLSPRHLRRFAAVASVILAFALGANLLRSLPRDRMSAGHTGLYRAPVGPELRRGIEALSPTELIAGDPEAVSWVSLVCRRQVFLDLMGLFPLNLIYYRQALADLRDQQTALFASDFDVVQRFARAHGVSVILVDRETYASPGHARSPWADSYSELIAPSGVDFALLHPPLERVLVDDGRWLLVSMKEPAKPSP